MTPLPYAGGGAKIAFYVILVIFVILEQRIRLRSWRTGRGPAPITAASIS